MQTICDYTYKSRHRVESLHTHIKKLICQLHFQGRQLAKYSSKIYSITFPKPQMLPRADVPNKVEGRQIWQTEGGRSFDSTGVRCLPCTQPTWAWSLASLMAPCAQQELSLSTEPGISPEHHWVWCSHQWIFLLNVDSLVMDKIFQVLG